MIARYPQAVLTLTLMNKGVSCTQGAFADMGTLADSNICLLLSTKVWIANDGCE